MSSKTIRICYIVPHHPESYSLIEEAIQTYQPDTVMLVCNQQRCDALDKALERGTPVVFGDRDGWTTLNRAIYNQYLNEGILSSLWWFFKLTESKPLLYTDTLQNEIRAIPRVDQVLPKEIRQPFFDERELILGNVLKALEGDDLAIVGAAHRQGIERVLYSKEIPDLSRLNKPANFWMILRFTLIDFVTVAFVTLFVMVV